MDTAATKKVEELLILSLEGVISPEEVKTLNELVKSDPEMMRHSVRFLVNISNLQRSAKISAFDLSDYSPDSSFDMELWRSLAENEKTAPTIMVEQPKQPPLEPVQMLKVEKMPRQINKFSLATAIISLAAMLLMIAYVMLMPPAASQVATLTDSAGAKWADSPNSTAVGSRLFNYGEPMQLLKGVVKIEFDYGAEVILEAPAEIRLESPERMTMNYGKLHAYAPRQSSGFTVDTPSASLIDLGTKFGVMVDIDGSCGLHMFKGKVNLIAGEKGQSRTSQIVTTSQAKRVDSETGNVKDVTLAQTGFVRYMDSQKNILWRGQSLDLVDLASGGNGLNVPSGEYVINPVTGKKTFSSVKDRDCGNEYRATPWNSLIDGVFVPNGTTPQMISSAGHRFQECPPTNGIFYSEIIFNPVAIDRKHKTSIRGKRYGAGEATGLFMHANLGITFDLETIRSQYSGVELKRFISQVGSCDEAPAKGNADVWVLVDGEIRYNYIGLTQGQLEDISVELSAADRFLTLVTTDGRDEDFLPSSPKTRASDSDWCLFVEPVIDVE